MDFPQITRRTFLKSLTAVTGGLIITFHLPLTGHSPTEAIAASDSTPPPRPLNAWLRIGTDETITVVVPHSEMGQGVQTALPMLVAEELDVDWNNVRVALAPLKEIYAHPGLGQQATGSSASVAGRWLTLREAGATARERLIRAAAMQWQVKPTECHTASGKIILTTNGKMVTYGSLAEEAAKLKPSTNRPSLRSPRDFKIIGKPLKRLDTPAKVDGSAIFGIDVRVPNMWYAAVKQAPVFGSKVKTYDATAVKGLQIVEIPNGIAVVAASYWQARQGLEKLHLQFEPHENEKADTASITQKLRQGLSAPPSAKIFSRGRVEAAFRVTAKIQESDYSVPFLAHVTMEPMNCTIDVREDSCEVWVPTQAQEKVRDQVAEITGLLPEQITVYTTYLGGGFGRRLEIDFVIQAVLISKAIGKPVKVIWSREEDIQHDFYRPAMVAKLMAGLNVNQIPVVFAARIIGPSILSRTMPTWLTKNLDYVVAQGISELPYQIQHQYIDYVMTDTPVPVGFWRSLGHSYNAFFVESFIDQIAHATKKDPFELRRELLKQQPAFLQVLDTLATQSGWQQPAPAGRYRGMAIHKSFGSIVGQVAEIAITAAGEVNIHRVISVINCGIVVNPNLIEAQIESGIVYGLSALKQAITIKNGMVEQSNFHDYPVLRMADMPQMAVHILPSEEYPSGVGEIATPPIAPAVTNAIFAATGKRIRDLPINPESLKGKASP